jgi:hypothetical protein
VSTHAFEDNPPVLRPNRPKIDPHPIMFLYDVAGGNKQSDHISKEDASSPTVATESVLLTSVIAAEEGRDVATVDIPNVFIQTKVEDEKHMVIINQRSHV